MDWTRFHWMNQSECHIEGDSISILATPVSDFFCNGGTVAEEGITPASTTNAPYYYTEVSGDFVFHVKVSHAFKDTYDSASIMVLHDLRIWAKACFELTDFGTHAAVSVVTNNTSDDANGCNLEGNAAWLQITRVGNAFAFHYSTDGAHFYMMRFFNLPVGETVKVGMLAQAPTGPGGSRIYEHPTLEHRTVKNIRMGE